jgi:hypothetical protein
MIAAGLPPITVALGEDSYRTAGWEFTSGLALRGCARSRDKFTSGKQTVDGLLSEESLGSAAQ